MPTPAEAAGIMLLLAWAGHDMDQLVAAGYLHGGRRDTAAAGRAYLGRLLEAAKDPRRRVQDHGA